MSVRQGIDYLSAIAHSLLRQGFKRQVYISFHGPAHMTCSPMVRDFFDETGVPILYIDLSMQMFKSAKDLFKSMDAFHAITVGAYQLLGRLEDVPLTTEYSAPHTQTCAPFNCSHWPIRAAPRGTASQTPWTTCPPPPFPTRPRAKLWPAKERS